MGVRQRIPMCCDYVAAAHQVIVRRASDSSVKRRYSHFHFLNKLLSARYEGFKVQLPPKRSFFNLDKTFIKSRRVKLDAWLQSALAHDRVCHSYELRCFLDASDSTFSRCVGGAVVPGRYGCSRRPHDSRCLASC